MSESSEAAKQIYNEMNTAMETALVKAAQRFNADDWDALTHPEPKDHPSPNERETEMIHIPMTIQAPELTPTRAHDDDAGLDLRTADSVRIPVGGSVEVSTGVAVSIPKGSVGYVHSRSSLGFKYDVALSNSTGVIDAGYIGIIRVKLSNRGQSPVTFNRGDRIIQLIIHKLPAVNYILVKDLEVTQRGDAGIGSTGAA